MRLAIRHELVHRYDRPAKAIIHNLRLAPRSHEGQHVAHWRIDLDVECRLKASQDAFGNIVHSFTLDGPLDALSVTALGEVETFDTRGIVAGSLERFPPELFLRPTTMTEATAEVRVLAEMAREAGKDELARLHALLRGLAEEAGSRSAQSEGPSGPAQAQSAGPADAEELAHRFIACARLIDIPARFVAGYRLAEAHSPQARHGWAEAHVGGLGWVGFDPANGVCPDERYVRVAIGLDAHGAAATRGAHAAGPDRPSEERVAIREARSRGA